MKSGINRREFIKAVGLGGATLTIPGCMSGIRLSASRPYMDKPNIVLIMADDLGCECLDCYGGTSYKTPFLDELAKTGIRFEHCYSQPLCTPSRVKIMTGQYNFRNYTEFGILDPGQRTFGHIMQNRVYATCVAGKWQLYGSVNQRREIRGTGSLPGQAGFDEYCLWQIEKKGSRYADPMIEQNGEYRQDLKGRYGPDVFCEYILDFIERHKREPFLVYYPMVLVHRPFVPTPDSEDWKESRDEDDVKYFGDMVAYMDKIVGRIVRKLDELGLRKNTLVLFTSDNGTHESISSKMRSRVIQGGKGGTTDAGTHVPLITNWKGVVPEGKLCSDLIDFSDFLPTLAEVAGASLSENVSIDGRSFLPQLLGEEGNPRDWIFCHYDPQWGKRKQKRFARDKRWKLYHNGELFDVQVDPLEENPVKSDWGGREAGEARQRLQAVLDSMTIS
jgi:arylsulfatase A-like enzyme